LCNLGFFFDIIIPNMPKEDLLLIDQDIVKIQNSTRTTVPGLIPLHNKLRMKYSWYYKWHLWRHAKSVHIAILFAYIAILASLGILSHQATSPITANATSGSWGVASEVAGSTSMKASAVIGGELYGAFLGSTSGLFKLNGASWESVASGSGAGEHMDYSIGSLGSDLYVGGYDDSICMVDGGASSLAKVVGSSIVGVSGGPSCSQGVVSISAFANYDSKLFLGGLYTGSGSPMDLRYPYLTTYDGANIAGVKNAHMDGGVKALAVYGSDLYVGGSFTEVGQKEYTVSGAGSPSYDGVYKLCEGSACNMIGAGDRAAYYIKDGTDTSHYLRYGDLGYGGAHFYLDGDLWGPLYTADSPTGPWSVTPGFETWGAPPGSPSAPAPTVTQTGNFISANHIAKYNGTTWSAVGTGVNGDVNSLLDTGDGYLVAGGAFTTAGGNAANRVAAWNGSSWSALGSGLNGTVYALSPPSGMSFIPESPDPKVVVGGSFTTAGGISAPNVAFWTGSAWEDMGGGTDGVVNTIFTKTGGELYLGGAFTHASGVATQNIAQWTDTTPSPTPTPSPSPSVIPTPSPSPLPTATQTGGLLGLTISGTVSQNSSGLSGVTVQLHKLPPYNVTTTTTTNVVGNYAFDQLGEGDYVITPSMDGKYFDPDHRDVTLVAADSTGNDFATYNGSISPTPDPSASASPSCSTNNAKQTISPSIAYVRPGADQTFSSQIVNTCNEDISKSCTVVWNVLNPNVGSLSQVGVLTAGSTEGNYIKSIKASADCSGYQTMALASVVITEESRRLEQALIEPYSFRKVRKDIDPDQTSYNLIGIDQFLNRIPYTALGFDWSLLDTRMGTASQTESVTMKLNTSDNYGCYYNKVKGNVSYRDVTKTALSSLYIYPPAQTSFIYSILDKALAQTTSRYLSAITMVTRNQFQPGEAYSFYPVARDQYGEIGLQAGTSWTFILNDPAAGSLSTNGNFIATTTAGYYPKAFSVRGVNGEHTVVITRDITVSSQRRIASSIKVWINAKFDTSNLIKLVPNDTTAIYAELYDQFGDFIVGPYGMRLSKVNPDNPITLSGQSITSTSSESGAYTDAIKLSFAWQVNADTTLRIDGPSPELLLSVDVNSQNETDPGACLLSTPDQSPTVNSPTPSPIVSQTITQIPDPSVTPTDSRTTVPAIASPTGTPTTSQTPSVEESRTPVVGVTISSVPPGSGSSPTGLGSVIETIVKPFTSSESQSPVTTAVLTALAAAAAVPAAIASSSVFPVFLDLMRWPIVILSRLKKRPKWGVVYDAISKQPLSGVMVRIFDNNKRLRETIYTGKDGAFGFLADAGSYTITASKYGYTFPSNIVPGKADNQYQSVYHGEPLELSESITKIDQTVPIHVSIPLDLNYLSAEKKARVAGSLALKRALDYARIPVLVIGTILAIDVLIIKNRWWDYLIMAVYAILWIYEIKEGTRPKMFGSVYDEQGNHINLPIIRAFDHMGRIKATVIGRQDGKFTMNLEPGVYTFEVSRLGYETYKSGKTKIASITDLGKLRFSLHKKPLV